MTVKSSVNKTYGNKKGVQPVPVDIDININNKKVNSFKLLKNRKKSMCLMRLK